MHICHMERESEEISCTYQGCNLSGTAPMNHSSHHWRVPVQYSLMLLRLCGISPAVPLSEWEDHQLAHLLGEGPEDEDEGRSIPSSSAIDDLTTCTKGGQANGQTTVP